MLNGQYIHFIDQIQTSQTGGQLYSDISIYKEVKWVFSAFSYANLVGENEPLLCTSNETANVGYDKVV